MKILVTGANGYIGRRIVPALEAAGHDVIALVRRPIEGAHVQADLLAGPPELPEDIDAAYYLVHSMGRRAANFAKLEVTCAKNFAGAIGRTRAKQVIYLSGLSGSHSEHMRSRHRVEEVLRRGSVPVTVLRAGIIIGSGSASFEIIRDLVEKLPVMIAPRWVKSRCQPLGIADVLFYLIRVLGDERTQGRTFDIGGPDLLTYREMMLQFARARGLHRSILLVPVLTPRLSSYWLFFVTNTSFPLARALVDSLRGDAICSEQEILKLYKHRPMSYLASLERTFQKIEQNAVTSSWRDAINMTEIPPDAAEAPKRGVLTYSVTKPFSGSRERVIERIWEIGGKRGWYYMDWAWNLRGLADRFSGGVGRRRGRTNPEELRVGDALDFWRVLVADREAGHLLLYAEMRIPGEAWLDLRAEEGQVVQRAIFRPRGVWGRLYWWMLYPIHVILFHGLCRALVRP